MSCDEFRKISCDRSWCFPKSSRNKAQRNVRQSSFVASLEIVIHSAPPTSQKQKNECDWTKRRVKYISDDNSCFFGILLNQKNCLIRDTSLTESRRYTMYIGSGVIYGKTFARKLYWRLDCASTSLIWVFIHNSLLTWSRNWVCLKP